MKVVGSFKFLGIESKQGKKDPTSTYYNVSLLQGINPVRVGVKTGVITQFADIKQMDDIEAELEVVMGADYSYARIANVRKVDRK